MTQKKPLAVMTMVRDDHHWARLWLSYYSQQVENPKDLYIIIHGRDQYLEKLFSECSVISVPIDQGGLVNFERKRLDFEHFFIRGLQAYFDCVILVDIDEFITTSPEVNQPLYQYLPTAHKGEMVRSALGFEVVDRPDDPHSELDFNRPILTQRRWAYCNAQYSKPCAFYFNFGGATHHRVWDAPWIIDPDLLLFHLRYCDRVILGNYMASRKQLYNEQAQAGNATSGSWRAPWREYRGILKQVETFDEGTLDLPTRHDLRRKILKKYAETNRIGKISSGYLSIPDDIAELL